MQKLLSTTALAAVMAVGIIGGAAAVPLTGAFNVTVSEGLTNGNPFDTVSGNPFAPVSVSSNTASATFVYTGAINFSNTAAQNGPGPGGDLNSAFGFTTGNVSGYSGSGTVTYNAQQVANYTTVAAFLGSSGSASSFTYGSYYTFDLGIINAGTTLTITHDDGVSLYQGNTRVGTSASGANSVTTDVITVGSTGDVILRYARENGTPSILQIDRSSVTVPEPASLGMMVVGLIGLCSLRRLKGHLGV